MSKRNNIIYWISTLWLCLGMTATGFFFIMAGAIYSHIAVGDPAKELFPSLLLLVLKVVSWNFRPVDRKLVLSGHH